VKWGRELVLALVVLVAGAAWYVGVKHEQQQLEGQEQALFPGFDPARVRCIIAENTLRDWRMRLEHDERGGWRLVDPSALPANFWKVEHLLQKALTARGREVPESERNPSELGFEPPRLVLEIEELLDGQSRHERVEIGALDADGRSVNVRVRGHYLRVLRDLDTALDRQLDEFKTELALEFPIMDVVRVQRSGMLQAEGKDAPADVALELQRTEEGWRGLKPEGLQLDPTLVMTWLQGLAAMHHAGYYDELGAPLSTLGLDPPELRVELELRDGSKQALRLGRPGHEGQLWLALREGLGVVWTMEVFPVYLAGYPVEDMVDTRILRARREDVTTITLHSRQGDLYFTPAGKQWRVALRRPQEKALDKPVPAEAAKVEELLSALEQVELSEFRLGQSVPESEDSLAIWVGVGGLTQGGWLGEAVQSQAGADCVLFQRRGENACSLAPHALLELLSRPIDAFWSMKLAEIAEHAQATLSIRGQGKDLRYVRNAAGRWARAESPKEEAKELHPVLDALCFLGAARYLTPRVELEGDDVVTVEFRDAVGNPQQIQVGRAPQGKPGEEIEVLYDGRHAVAKDQGLHERLLRILAGP
jgi:hypothetical protein